MYGDGLSPGMGLMPLPICTLVTIATHPHLDPQAERTILDPVWKDHTPEVLYNTAGRDRRVLGMLGLLSRVGGGVPHPVCTQRARGAGRPSRPQPHAGSLRVHWCAEVLRFSIRSIQAGATSAMASFGCHTSSLTSFISQRKK